MRALYKKESSEDPQKEGETYTNHMLLRETEFCCEKFKDHCKKFTVWSYDYGKFSIVDEITYEGNSVNTIDFCPFCGEKIDYEDIDSPRKIRKRKK